MKLMKVILTLGAVWMLSIPAQANVFNCERSNAKKMGLSYFYNYAQLVTRPDQSILFFTEKSEAELEKTMESSSNNDFFIWRLVKDKGSKVVYSTDDLEEVKKTHDTASVLTLPKKLIGDSVPGSLAYEPTKIEIENRDYDYDYSGWFFYTHGYVIQGSAEYQCFLKQ